MNVEQIREIVKKQREFFQSGATLPVKFRIAMLKKLYGALKKYETEIGAALHEDLGKSAYEGFMCETGMALSEIRYTLKRVRKWAKAKKVRTPLAQFSAGKTP